jgi:hypothetical protein
MAQSAHPRHPAHRLTLTTPHKVAAGWMSVQSDRYRQPSGNHSKLICDCILPSTAIYMCVCTYAIWLVEHYLFHLKNLLEAGGTINHSEAEIRGFAPSRAVTL